MHLYPPIKKSSSGKARIGVLSLRNIQRHVSRCYTHEFEDTIYQIDHADLLSPVPRIYPKDLLSRYTRRLQRELFRKRQAPVATNLVVEQDYDVFIAFCGTIHDLRVLKSVQNWKQRSRKKVCWVTELWETHIENRADLLEILAEFDFVILNVYGTLQPLQKAIGRPVFYYAPGIDTIAFCPYPKPPKRCIDIYSMGRRSSVTHEALLEVSKKEGMFYLFDTIENMTTRHLEQHR